MGPVELTGIEPRSDSRQFLCNKSLSVGASEQPTESSMGRRYELAWFGGAGGD